MFNLRKIEIEIAFLEDCSETILYRIHSESHESCLFNVLLFSVTATAGHLRLPCRII